MHSLSNISIDFSQCLTHSLVSNLRKVNYHVAYFLALIYILANPIGTAKSNFCQILPINLCKIEFILFSSCLCYKCADKTAIRIISSRCCLQTCRCRPSTGAGKFKAAKTVSWCGRVARVLAAAVVWWGLIGGWHGVVCCGLMWCKVECGWWQWQHIILH